MEEVITFEDTTEQITFSKHNGWIAIFQENKSDSDQNISILEKENVIVLRDWLSKVIDSFNFKG